MSRSANLPMEGVLDLKSRVSTAKPLDYMRDHPEERQKRTQRFNNEKVTDLGLQFDSKAEHKRWSYLAKLERDGEISRLRLQVPFELIPAQVAPDGTKVRATVYVADFTYLDKDGVLIVEDPKGVSTPEWRIKRKLMLMVHGIWVREIRS